MMLHCVSKPTGVNVAQFDSQIHQNLVRTIFGTDIFSFFSPLRITFEMKKVINSLRKYFKIVFYFIKLEKTELEICQK